MTVCKQFVNQIPEMKLKETIAGAPPYSLSSSQIEVVLKNSYSTSFNSPQAVTSQKGSEMGLPGGLTDQLLSSVPANKTNSTLTIGTSMNGVAFNPVANMKGNSNINTSDLGNVSCTIADPTIIGKIYADLAAGKLNGVVDTKKQSSDIIETSFTPSEIKKDGSSSTISDSPSVSKLPPGKKVNWTLPVSRDPNNSIAMPMYYVPETDSWTNKGCVIIESNNPNVTVCQCDNLGAPDVNITTNSTNSTRLAKGPPINVHEA